MRAEAGPAVRGPWGAAMGTPDGVWHLFEKVALGAVWRAGGGVAGTSGDQWGTCGLAGRAGSCRLAVGSDHACGVQHVGRADAAAGRMVGSGRCLHLSVWRTKVPFTGLETRG